MPRMLNVVEKYRPSNGMEGDVFMHNFCQRCVHDNFDATTGLGGCRILAATLCFQIDDPNYPAEWVYGPDDEPTCTSFEVRA